MPLPFPADEPLLGDGPPVGHGPGTQTGLGGGGGGVGLGCCVGVGVGVGLGGAWVGVGVGGAWVGVGFGVYVGSGAWAGLVFRGLTQAGGGKLCTGWPSSAARIAAVQVRVG